MARKSFEVNLRFPGTGRPADKVIVEAINPPEAKERAERQYGGQAGGCRQIY